MTKLINTIGERYGKLIVIHELRNGKIECLCDCGNKIVVLKNNVRKGNTISCGCYKKEQTVKRVTKHNDYGSIEYFTWQRMLQRCYNENYSLFRRYGGRGINVCDEWRENYECFLKDMGRRPVVEGIKYSLDRIDNNQGYSKNNCKWSTASEQNRNRGAFRRRKREV